jgi:DNA-binding LytR/AlgR family response regulator
MINCIIVDDEPLAQEVLANHISHYGQLQLVARCNHAVEAFAVLHQQKIDLMFLDIRMPGVSGIDFVKSLNHPPKVIFTTAYSEYALTGFELDAVDYLLKPITYERFEKSLQKLFRLHPDKADEAKNYTYFKVSGKLIKVLHADLLFAQSVKDYVLLQTPTVRYLIHMTMKYLTDLLPADTFLRVHRSYLVNRQHINRISKTHVQVDSESIPIGEIYRSNLKPIN